MIKKLIIGMIFLICIISGVFAAMSYYDSANSTNVDSNSTIGDSNDAKPIENSLITFINNNKDFTDNDFQYSYGYVVNVNGELRHYITDKGAYYLESEGLTDRYIQCVECGGFVPVGDITNPLPEKYLCHCNAMNKLSDSYKEFTWSRDEAYTYSQNYLEITRSHYELESDEGSVYAIYCKDCNGFVQYFNPTELMENHHLADYLRVKSLLNTWTFGSGPTWNINCSHYNGTLNIYDMFYNHPEELHSGWFKNQDTYHKVMQMYSGANYSNKLLAENSTTTENNNLEEPITDTIDTYPENNENMGDFNQYPENYYHDGENKIYPVFDLKI